MKKSFFILLSLILLLVKCDSIFGPGSNDPEISVKFLGETTGTYSVALFKVTNNTKNSTWYLGNENFPFYQIETKADSGWANRGPGWCGTGASFYEVKFYSSFNFQVGSPEKSCIWRVGVRFYKKNNDFDCVVYSDPIND